MRDIGKNIKTVRTQKNMTQDELAEKLFVTRQTVSNYETGRSRPDVETLMKIADVLEVDVQALLYEPVTSVERKKRLLLAAVIGLVVLLLGIGLKLGLDHTNELATMRFLILPNIVMGVFVRPAYYFLLGMAAAVCWRILVDPRPLPSGTAKGICWGVLAFVVFYLLCQAPWIFRQITFPRFWFDLCNLAMRAVNSHFWFFLIPGGALGLCWKVPEKKSSDT